MSDKNMLVRQKSMFQVHFKLFVWQYQTDSQTVLLSLLKWPKTGCTDGETRRGLGEAREWVFPLVWEILSRSLLKVMNWISTENLHLKNAIRLRSWRFITYTFPYVPGGTCHLSLLCLIGNLGSAMASLVCFFPRWVLMHDCCSSWAQLFKASLA